MMMKAMLRSALLLALLPSVLMAAEHVVEQKDKQFLTQTLTIKAGDSVRFLNNDSAFHNVFSLSETRLFDLGSYPQGQSKSVTFSQAGTVEVECAFHPEMKMIIEVQ